MATHSTTPQQTLNMLRACTVNKSNAFASGLKNTFVRSKTLRPSCEATAKTTRGVRAGLSLCFLNNSVPSSSKKQRELTPFEVLTTT